MSRKHLNKGLAIMLAFSMSVNMLPMHNVMAAEQINDEEIKYEQINIKTAEEFAEFAKECYIDSWSKDKYVTLKADIDLTGTEYETLPVFSGIFDGSGHTISGFNYTGDGYVVGLFRYIESSAIVKNLNLKGSIWSENEKECIGSICGINYGTIKNCTFEGTVSGEDTVGGIAGINESTGTISGCSVKGRITGYYSTGGVTGINHGAINYCTNRAGINDDSAWVLKDDEIGEIDLISTFTKNDENEIYSGVDTGGIVGYSDGIISRCTNTGIVGYEHTGYNIGGIAGRQSGIVSLSTNNGTVYGRKDVGGIVGQMEPYIEINEAESLKNAVNKLHDLIEKTIDDMDRTSDAVTKDVNEMQSFADSAVDSGDELVNQMTDFVDNNVEEINSVAERMEHIIDMLPSIFDDVSKAGNAMNDFNNVLKRLNADLDILGRLDDAEYVETDYGRISLLSNVGGTLTSDSTNPEENDTVTITAKPDEGYVLKSGSPKAEDSDGNNISLTEAAGSDYKYTFVMPDKNWAEKWKHPKTEKT